MEVVYEFKVKFKWKFSFKFEFSFSFKFKCKICVRIVTGDSLVKQKTEASEYIGCLETLRK